MLLPPADAPYRLMNVAVPAGTFTLSAEVVPATDSEGCALLDIGIDAAGRIDSVLPAGTWPTPDGVIAVPLRSRQLWPGLVDAHAHIDKSHTWRRSPNADGTLLGARAAAKRDRMPQWSFDDVYRRMDFAVRCARVHGTVALRTHLDSQEGRTEPTWTAFTALRQAWAGRMTIQGVATLGIAKLAGAWGEHVGALLAQHDGILGPVVYDNPELQAQLDRAFDLAEAYGLDLDIHVDETGDPEADGLTRIARTVLRRGFKGRVTCDHACSLAMRAPDDVARTVALVREAGIGIVSLPMTNIYLLDRAVRRTPRWRGITLIHELKAGGVPVAVGGDNVRDAFHPYGDHDMVDVFRDAARLGHLDLPVGDWPGAVSATAAAVIGLPGVGTIAAGNPADLVIFEGRDYSEVLARHGTGRVVLRGGQVVDDPLPDYRELD
jgi:cytosine deaminase